MKRCRKCGIQILDPGEVCPLCGMVLEEIVMPNEKGQAQVKQTESPLKETADIGETSDQEEALDSNEYLTYPDIRDISMRRRRYNRIILFFGVLAEFILIIINYYTYGQSHTHWSIVTGGCILYMIYTVWDVSNHRTGRITKVYMQSILGIGLLFLIDGAFGFKGWSYQYGLPFAILAINVLVLVYMIVDFANWQNYMVLQIFTILLSVIYMGLYLRHIVSQVVLAWVALGVSCTFMTGILAIGDKKATNELKRKFHI